MSNYVPKSILIPLDLPYILQTFCKYLISLSGALVVLNVVPCYALDGQWILHAFIEMSLGPFVTRHARTAIFTSLLMLGTALLATNIIIALWSLFR